MKKHLIKLFIIFLLADITSPLYAMNVAITVDDVPANGDVPSMVSRSFIADKMLKVFKKHHVFGIYGLINGSKTEKNSESMNILKDWISQGQLLGNHTYSHLDLTKVSAKDFIADIKKNEPILKNVMVKREFRYFRYPYLSEGNTQEKRDTVRQYLFNNQYKIAQVTVDFFEYEWNDPYVRCQAKHDLQSIAWLKKTYIEQALNALTISHSLSMMLYSRDIKNILLIHINSFTTEMLDELLTAYEKHGVKFISLNEALSDEIYIANPNIIRDRSYTFLNQVRLSEGLENPDIVKQLYASLPEEKLNKLCG